jgi:RimJ/RimL family protein N-acetyltransferase
MEILLSTCRLRPWAWEDADSLVRHANNPNVSRFLRDAFPFPYTPEAANEWLSRVVGREPVRNFVIDVGGEAVGSVSLRPKEDIYHRTAELAYWLSENHWGRGIATEAARAMVAYGFATFGLARIEADVMAPNQASVRVLEKTGLTLEGRLRKAMTKHGETVDALLYAIVAP